MKRTRHSNDFKLQIVKEALESGNKAAVARLYEIATNMLHRWVKDYESGKLGEVSQGYAVTLVLPLVKIPRSTYYYSKVKKSSRKQPVRGDQHQAIRIKRMEQKCRMNRFKNGSWN